MKFTGRTVKSLFAQLQLAGVETIQAFGKVDGRWEAVA